MAVVRRGKKFRVREALTLVINYVSGGHLANLGRILRH